MASCVGSGCGKREAKMAWLGLGVGLGVGVGVGVGLGVRVGVREAKMASGWAVGACGSHLVGLGLGLG